MERTIVPNSNLENKVEFNAIVAGKYAVVQIIQMCNWHILEWDTIYYINRNIVVPIVGETQIGEWDVICIKKRSLVILLIIMRDPAVCIFNHPIPDFGVVNTLLLTEGWHIIDNAHNIIGNFARKCSTYVSLLSDIRLSIDMQSDRRTSSNTWNLLCVLGLRLSTIQRGRAIVAGVIKICIPIKPM